MTDLEIVATYSKQFRDLDDNLDDLVRRAEDFAQANQTMGNWEQAMLNYRKARDTIFSSHTEELAALLTGFVNAQASSEEALADLKSGAATLIAVGNVISAAVKAGKQLVDKADALDA